MIRINLIATRGQKRKRPALQLQLGVPNMGMVLVALALLLEGGGLYLWYDSAFEEAEKASKIVKEKQRQIEELKKVKADIEAIKAETEKLDAQEAVFKSLRADREGPVNALVYLSYILADRDNAASVSPEESRALEQAGLRGPWKSNQAWFTSFKERDGEVVLTGEARDHDDVAEVQRRLEASAYYRNVRLNFQERKVNNDLGQFPFVAFQITAALVYDVEHKPDEPKTGVPAVTGQPIPAPGAPPGSLPPPAAQVGADGPDAGATGDVAGDAKIEDAPDVAPPQDVASPPPPPQPAAPPPKPAAPSEPSAEQPAAPPVEPPSTAPPPAEGAYEPNKDPAVIGPPIPGVTPPAAPPERGPQGGEP